MAIMNVGSSFINLNNIVKMNLTEVDNGVVITAESDHVADDTFVPEVTLNIVAAAIRQGLRTNEKVFDLLHYIDKVRAYRGE